MPRGKSPRHLSLRACFSEARSEALGIESETLGALGTAPTEFFCQRVLGRLALPNNQAESLEALARSRAHRVLVGRLERSVCTEN